MMCAPLLVEDEILGIIQLDTQGRAKPFTTDDLQVLTGVCSQAAIAVKNARLLARLETANVALQREMAERQQAEAASHRARESAAHAQAASHAKNEILANISHELRTPMNGVVGMMALLSDTQLNAEQHEYVDTIRQCSRNLLALINEILDFSEMEAGRLRLEHADFNLRSVVQEILGLFTAEAKHKGLELTCQFHDDVPAWVTGDPGRLRQALKNLVGNAVKFTATGTIAVAVRPDSRRGQLGTWICFAVTDTGIGIAPEVREQIFQAFRQVDSSTTRQYGGTGLGLAIVRHLATLMGGEVDVDSTPGQGSTFWLTVPLTPCPELQPEAG
jgi:signal transduction histidine kinase